MDTSRFQALRLTVDDGVVWIELDHGRANEMGRALVDEWAALTDAVQAAGVHTLVTFSRRRSRRGTPIFISGADVTERRGWSQDQVRAHVRHQRQVLRGLRAAPVFHIAVVDGVALGWGAEFLLTCDYRIAGPEARIGLPETGLGIIPGAGGTAELWAQVGVAQALRMGMSGEQIDAAEALRIGLVQERADSLEAGLARARELARKVGRRSPTAVATYKAAVLAATTVAPAARAELEAVAYEHCLDSGDAAIGRENFEHILKGEEAPWGPRRSWSR